jgi:hypothetical protein
MLLAMLAGVACFLMAGVGHAGIITIDTFNDTAQVVNKAAPGPDTAATAPGEALGGFRTIGLTTVIGPLDATLVADGPTDFLSLSNDVDTSSEALVTWDAGGAGLGGVDFLDGFLASERLLSLSIVSVDIGLVDLRVRIFDTFGFSAFANILSPGPGAFTVKLSNFIGAATVDFTSVDRVNLRIKSDPESDLAVDTILIIPIPEPSTVVLLGISILGILGVSYYRRKN